MESLKKHIFFLDQVALEEIQFVVKAVIELNQFIVAKLAKNAYERSQ